MSNNLYFDVRFMGIRRGHTDKHERARARELARKRRTHAVCMVSHIGCCLLLSYANIHYTTIYSKVKSEKRQTLVEEDEFR